MSIEEESLRDLLASPHAEQCVRSILTYIRNGVHVTIDMTDGKPLTLVGVEEAELALKLWFGWTATDEARD